MNAPGRVRRRATVRWAGDPGAVAWAGAKALPQAWPVLAAHFRDVLLAPRRQDDDAGVEWVWTEAPERAEATAADCAALRRRLTAGVELFEEWAEADAERADARAKAGGGERAEVGRAAAAWVRTWNGKTDTEARRWIARTEHGWRLHSWGAAAPADVEELGAKAGKATAADEDAGALGTTSGRGEDAEGGATGGSRESAGKRRRAWLPAAVAGGLGVVAAGAWAGWPGRVEESAAERREFGREGAAERRPEVRDGQEGTEVRHAARLPGAEREGGGRSAGGERARSAREIRPGGEPRARDGLPPAVTGLPGENRGTPNDGPTAAGVEASAAGIASGNGGGRGGAGSGAATPGAAGGQGVAAADGAGAGTAARAAATLTAAPVTRKAEVARDRAQGARPEANRRPASVAAADVANGETGPRVREPEREAENSGGVREGVATVASPLPDPVVAERRFRADRRPVETKPAAEEVAERRREAGFVAEQATTRAATRDGEGPEPDAQPAPGSEAARGRQVGSDAGFAVTRLVRPIRWEVRLLDDAIVPTVPRLAGEVDDAERLRAQVWAERRGRRPSGLDGVAMRQGVRWVAERGDGARAWTGRAVGGGIGITVDGAHAEAAWRDWPKRGEGWTTERGAGRADGGVEADGTMWWRATDGVRAWRWVELALAGAPEGTQRRWRWQLPGGDDLPAGWTATIEADGRARLEWPLEADAVATALAERASGWALVISPVGGREATR